MAILLLLYSFGKALIMTLVIELIVAYIFGIRRRGEVLVVVCVNTLTNPLVMLYYLIMTGVFPDVPGIVFQIPVEIMVIVVEALIYRSFSKSGDIRFEHPVLLAAAANIISWGTGVILLLVGIM